MGRFLIVSLTLLCWATGVVAGPYGKWGLYGFEDSEGIPANSEHPDMKIPTEKDVGIPAYPGAAVMGVLPAEGTACLVGMRVTDSVQSVCKYYAPHFPASEGYSHLVEEDMCIFKLTDTVPSLGVAVGLATDEWSAYHNGTTEILLTFEPKTNYKCL